MVSAFLLLTGYLLGAPFLVGLFASLPFGSTAFATLTSLGGSSPLIYTLFAAGFILTVALRKQVLRELGTIFTLHVSPWIVVLLTAYVIASAMIFPRLFAGQTTAFVPVEGIVTELPLAPVSGNITQTAYFTLGALTFLATSIFLLRKENLEILRRGFMVFIIVHVCLGIFDLAGKVAGVGDILLPIRTATYALHTETEQAGFWRIAGGYSEASAFGGTSLICLAFIYSYWRATRSQFALVLSLILLLLVLLSTSSTAYVGLAALSLVPVASLITAFYQNRLTSEDLLLAAVGAFVLAAILALFLYDEKLFSPVMELFQTTVLDKPLSQSAQERAYWNYKSVEAFIDTSGVGIGMGSSRSSSWIISVLSQLGLIGGLAILSLTVLILRGLHGLEPTADTSQIFAFASGVRAAIVAKLLADSIAGSGADPGLLFFMALPIITAIRRHVMRNTRVSRQPLAAPV